MASSLRLEQLRSIITGSRSARSRRKTPYRARPRAEILEDRCLPSVYNATSDFSPANNPNGVWSYGQSATLFSDFQLYSQSGPNNDNSPPANLLETWNAGTGGTFNYPGVLYNGTSNSISSDGFTFLPGQLGFHPGSVGQYSVVRFTAPVSGVYSLTSAFNALDPNLGPKLGDTDVHVLLNNVSIFDGLVVGLSSPASFRSSVALSVGDKLDFKVGYGPNMDYNSDMTGLVAILAPANVVTTTADTGPGSLRDTITQINADTSHSLYPSPNNSSVDEIDFNITSASDTGGGFNAGTGVATITPQQGLPTIGNAVLIDGYTQTGASPNSLALGDNAVLKVQLDLSAITPNYKVGLRVDADNSTIRGLVLNHLSLDAAILINAAGNEGDRVEGNFLGTDVTGTSVVGGGAGTRGVWFYDAPNGGIVGGTTPAARNIIAGFGGGVAEFADTIVSGAPGHVVEGNYIGTDASGTKALGNGDGVSINYYGGIIASNLISGNTASGVNAYTGAPVLIRGNLIGTDATGTVALGNTTGVLLGTSSTIGGTTPNARNIISGNGQQGIFAAYAPGALIEGNYIGTDITGTKAVAGENDGIWLWTSGETVGGSAPGDGNVISGNSIGIRGFSTNEVIQGNLIGTDWTGTNPLGNGYGLYLGDSTSNDLIGGTVPGAGNTIAYNSQVGVQLFVGDTGDTVLGNSIHGNGGGGFNAEGIQAAPVLLAATTHAGNTYIGGALASVANTSFRIEFFANASPDPSGHGQGQTYLGFVNVTTDGTGNADFIATFAGLAASKPYISTTATRLNGGTAVETSGFSNDVNALASASAYVVTTSADSGPHSLRDAINQTNADTSHVLYASPTNPNVDEIDFNITAPSDTGGGFNATTGVATITPSTALPSITNSAIINGYTESGASPNTLALADNAVLKIVLNGANSTGNDGLAINANNTTVRGLAINGWAVAGIGVSGTGDVVAGNFLGTDATGTHAVPNLFYGIVTQATNDVIGGTTPDARNLISGNFDGIALSAGSGTGNVIEGNLIGTNASGTSALGNTNDGIDNNSGPPDLLIGGTTAGARNVISGNGYGIGGGACLIEGNYIGTDITGSMAVGNTVAGIYDFEGGATIGGTVPGAGNLISGNSSGIFYPANDLIQGNLIGTDYTGTKAVGNSAGIYFTTNDNNSTIGGTTAAARNVISGNGYGLYFPGSSGNLIEGNFIGTDITGTKAIGNSVGVLLANGASGASFNTIGGTNAAARNIISGNSYAGVQMADASGGTGLNLPSNNVVEGNYIGTDVTGSAALGNSIGVAIGFLGNNVGVENNLIGGTAPGAGNVISGNTAAGVSISQATGNAILGNSIHDNGGGISLSNGGNHNQAAPVVAGLSGTAANPVISGSLTSVANTTFRIEFFANPLPSNLANTEGQTLLGSVYVTTNASGKATFTATGLSGIPVTQGYLTATATVATATNSGYAYGDTSQFSSYQHVAYYFGGFQGALSKGLNFALNRVIPIQFTLTDLTGAAVTSLAAVSSIQVAPVNTDGSLGTPFTPASPGNAGLSVSGGTYSFNWATKGLNAGSYAILLTLADGTVQAKVIQLTKSGNSSGLTTVAAGGTGSAPGGLLGGNIELYVDNTNGDLTADELARIQDAVTAVDAVTEPYGVAVQEVSDPTQADVTLNMDTTSAVGGYADGVLGCTTDAGQITIINGWNFYAGSDATQIGGSQYDFETVVTHELGHALGLGHSSDSTSVMYATLNTGTVNRSLTTADLNVPDSDTTGACGLHAAPPVTIRIETGTHSTVVAPALVPSNTARPVLVGAAPGGVQSGSSYLAMPMGTAELLFSKATASSPRSMNLGATTSLVTVPAAFLPARQASSGSGTVDQPEEPDLELPSPMTDPEGGIPVGIEQAFDALAAPRNGDQQQSFPMTGSGTTAAVDSVFAALQRPDRLIGPAELDELQPSIGTVDASWAWGGVLGLLLQAEARSRQSVSRRRRVALKP